MGIFPMGDFLDEASAQKNLSDKMLESISDKTKKKEAFPAPDDKSLVTETYSGGYANIRGRTVWTVYPRVGGSPGVDFRSPALGEGSDFSEKYKSAYIAAVKKGCSLLKSSPEDVIVIQAGGLGKFFDDDDQKLDLP